MVQPLIERDFYGRKPTGPITAPNLKQAYYTSAAKDAIALEFDQPVVWEDSLVNEFRLDGEKGKVASGIRLGQCAHAEAERAGAGGERSPTWTKWSWSQDRLLIGKNGIAALTFCNVPVSEERKQK